MTEQYSKKNGEPSNASSWIFSVEWDVALVYSSRGSEPDFSSFIKFKFDFTETFLWRISNHIITYMDSSANYDFLLSAPATSFSPGCVRTRRILSRNMTRHIDVDDN